MMRSHPLVLLGGSFDPIHNGHLWMAHEVNQEIAAHGIQAEIKFLPTAGSPFKNTATSTKHRLAMLKQALRDTPFSIDRTEVYLQPPTYTLDTLSLIRQRIGPDRPLIFVLGQDSFDSLPRWKGGYELLKLTHLWVFPRIEQQEQAILTLPDALMGKKALTTEQLLKKPQGLIFTDEKMPPEISSTLIRQHLATSEQVKLLKKSLPARVMGYNKSTKLYGFTSPYES
ncbi:nicotinate (nicotinamide) nucleotide adenylyltransferase [Aquirhabdus sp.]|uniref:nicotinate (nicotinamide) nucleotide adenylyltransferase n=1 Tax=Aquirhabdus sp. TaxID=2824160 RepID=UPI00396C4E91